MSQRLCVNCNRAEEDHADGVCLFDTVEFTPLRLHGSGEKPDLWGPVTVDVVIAGDLDEYGRGPVFLFESQLDRLVHQVVRHTGMPAQFLGINHVPASQEEEE